MGKELSASSVAALHFVANKHRVVLVACLAHRLHKFFVCQMYSAHTLYALHNHGTDIAFGYLAYKCLGVVERKEGNMTVFVDGRIDFGVIGSFHRKRCTSVKSSRRSNHSCASVVKRSKL